MKVKYHTPNSAVAGGNFWEGAAIGFAVTGFNHLMHDNKYSEEGVSNEESMKTEMEETLSPPDDFTINSDRTITRVSTTLPNHRIFVQQPDGSIILNDILPFNRMGGATGYDRLTSERIVNLYYSRQNKNRNLSPSHHAWINQEGLGSVSRGNVRRYLAILQTQVVRGQVRFLHPTIPGSFYMNSFIGTDGKVFRIWTSDPINP